MADLTFDCIGAQADRYAVTPTITLTLRISETSGQRIDTIALRTQIRIEPSRRRYTPTTITGLEHIEFPVASPEDTILEKLMWYQLGGQLSDRQWSDVLGIVTTRSLDLEYLREWAPKLGVADLLDRLFAESSQIHLL